MKLSDDLAWRGLIKDTTFGKTEWLDKPQTFYHGYDASSDSLTIGNLAALVMDRRLIDAGWKAVIVMGGGTSLVGDPGGKVKERQLKSREEIKQNIEAVREQVTQLFAGENYTMVDNHDWLASLKYLDFLRDVGKHFSMTELMQREFVTERMGEHGSGISYTEFSYSLVQAYDFWHLFKNYEVVLQIGGSDQWGNMLSGVSMVRKKEAKEVHALSMPLVISKQTGVKFGKSEAGAIWLDPAKTSPTQFYQFWINTDDGDVEDYLKIFSFLTKGQIEQVMADHSRDPAKRLAQTTLAKAVTELVHGGGGGDLSERTTKYLTSQVSLHKASPAEITQLKREIPNLKVKSGTSLIDILVKTGLASSKTEARRLLSSGAIYLNGQTVERELLAAADFVNGRALLRRGKAYKDSALIEHE
ncbi:TPA: tyrosine--tRNA ligase [Candidatus Saccharibacteria bacterium]|nr:MAG: Tyrosyl-tRNA synthetase [Candidatus Saccharibacteria bacterium GW2011_GWA2_46_10]OGL36188.1 MAG: tyrosine--tRNA ligase [Candidatus Saccharibacteria bacterium RIFCSPHIGHO2_12_FULL_47_17]HCM51710.1 tyrosine--tRNA ligase [Candidatus Saccharibacteria bacterium]